MLGTSSGVEVVAVVVVIGSDGWFSKGEEPLGGSGIMALGDIYGDCNAETKADEGGDTRGEP